MAEDRRAGPALLLLSGRTGPMALASNADSTESTESGHTRRRIPKPVVSRHARRVAIPSLSLAAAPLVHWTPSAARAGDAFRWAGSMLTLCEKGDPFVLLQHGGLRAADDAPATQWQPYAAWLAKHRSVWQAACRGVIVISSDIVTRVDARNDAQTLFGEGTRVVVVSQEALAHQLARVLIAERQTGRGNAGADVVARGSM